MVEECRIPQESTINTFEDLYMEDLAQENCSYKLLLDVLLAHHLGKTTEFGWLTSIVFFSLPRNDLILRQGVALVHAIMTRRDI